MKTPGGRSLHGLGSTGGRGQSRWWTGSTTGVATAIVVFLCFVCHGLRARTGSPRLLCRGPFAGDAAAAPVADDGFCFGDLLLRQSVLLRTVVQDYFTKVDRHIPNQNVLWTVIRVGRRRPAGCPIIVQIICNLRVEYLGLSFDVVIIGSGAGGGDHGAGAHLLGDQSGRARSRSDDQSGQRLQRAHVAPTRCRTVAPAIAEPVIFGHNPYAFGYFTASFGGWELDGEPYTAAPGNSFRWFRSRALGGANQSLRPLLVPVFPTTISKPYDRDGPRYELAHLLRRNRAVLRQGPRASSASPAPKKGIRSTPDGIFQTPPPPRVHELLVQRACRKLDIPCIPKPHGGDHEEPQRSCGLPLLRPVRSRAA